MPVKIKYAYLQLLLTLLITNCNTITTTKKQPKEVNSTLTVNVTDSLKFKKEIYSLDTLFNNLYKANEFNGNVLVAKGNEIIFKKSFGMANMKNGYKLSDTTLFQLASVSKVITGIAILLLVEQNKLNVETFVNQILLEFPYPNITVKQLLNHRSGLPNYIYFCSELLVDKDKVITGHDVLDVMVKHKPAPYLKPDTRFNYCNTNYVLLALIIEKISGNSYTEFVTNNIFTPLKMLHTFTIQNVNYKNVNLSLGYTANFTPVASDRFDGALGDKGIYTTTNDLFLLSVGLYHNNILNKQSQQLAYQPNSSEKKLSNYGLGWRIKNMNSADKEVFHNGWWHGFRTSFHRRLNDSVTIVILSNRLNKSVYSTWKIYSALDDGNNLNNKPEKEDD